MDNKKYSFVFMGVSGSGKTTVAEAIAQKLNVPFVDGDFLHPRSNINKMSAGIPLDNADREPWLEAVNSAIYAMQHTHKVSLIACSALKRKYRDALRKDNKGVCFIYLKGEYNLIARRLQERKNHFFKPQMLQSQFDVLEEPLNTHHDIFTVSIDESLESIIKKIISFIERRSSSD